MTLKTHCYKGHEYTPENTIINSKVNLQNKVCKICKSVRSKIWVKANSEQISKYHKDLYMQKIKTYRHNFIQNRYGISQTQWQIMYDLQMGVCAICEEPETTLSNGHIARLCIDHDHTCCSGVKSCGKCVRGLICRKCNDGLGRFRDNSTNLYNAAKYINYYTQRKDV